MIRVTVWNEFRHEKSSPKVAAIYPKGMHETIAAFLRAQPDMEVRTATLDEPEHGLTQEVLNRYGVDESDTEGLVNQPLAIASVIMSILVKEQPDGTLRVSVRSKRGVSANMCARTFFHGGGHEQAAGGKILVPEDVPSAGDAGEYAARSAEKFIGGDEQ